MKFSQPLVLLLGSVLSASGIGCSAITAVVSDSSPANRENRDDTDRLAAIGRVFENQGRYERAEVMYRKALRNRPQDSELRSQLQQLAARREEHKFGPTDTENAIAIADIVSPPKPNVRPVHRTVNATSGTSPSPESDRASSIGIATMVQQSPTFAQEQGVVAAAPVATPFAGPVVASVVASAVAPIAAQVAVLEPDVTPHIELTSGGNQGWRSRKQHAINRDDLLTALEQPDDHVDMLLEALNGGDGVEAKSLAATLLGGCDPGNTRVRDALVQQQSIQSDPEILLALCDSQIERNEADQHTINCLICLCTGFGSEIQIQAASQLRNFVGTQQESLCLAALIELLGSAVPNVRAIAAVTLGDFTSLESRTITQLQELADADADPNVREAAQATLTRQKPDPLQVVPTLSLTSER